MIDRARLWGITTTVVVASAAVLSGGTSLAAAASTTSHRAPLAKATSANFHNFQLYASRGQVPQFWSLRISASGAIVEKTRLHLRNDSIPLDTASAGCSSCTDPQEGTRSGCATVEDTHAF
jgi:hypothetical protein